MKHTTAVVLEESGAVVAIGVGESFPTATQELLVRPGRWAFPSQAFRAGAPYLMPTLCVATLEFASVEIVGDFADPLVLDPLPESCNEPLLLSLFGHGLPPDADGWNGSRIVKRFSPHPPAPSPHQGEGWGERE